MSVVEWLYFIGSFLFVIVGLLHTYVHYQQLINADAMQKLTAAGKIYVGRKKVEVWKLWQGMSLLFGILLMIVGVMNIISWYNFSSEKFPPSAVCIVNILLLLLIIFSGYKYFGKAQVYGGIFGVILFGLVLLLG